MAAIKKILLPVVLLVGGVGVGTGAAVGANMLLGPPPEHGAEEQEDQPTALVAVDDILAPLVLPDGERLAGYVSFQVALEVPEDRAEEIGERLPILRHEINMRTYLSPMASGPDGTLPTLEVFRDIVDQSAIAAFGEGAVERVAISEAKPA